LQESGVRSIFIGYFGKVKCSTLRDMNRVFGILEAKIKYKPLKSFTPQASQRKIVA